MRHGLPSPWVAGRTDYARWRGYGMPADEKCRNTGGRKRRRVHTWIYIGRRMT
ncbi:hypothetical protein BURMUCF1_3459 [Burkholderia multivorans ATCC BAA-247]|uniref:Uncharacterized protein n=1 Tax=Burkholderia multivorans CGD2 TaxID=513052 RepID=B9C0A6_9BURK|nr:hypothetical protein BURMUCGD2_0093 [Burkholderia multivorans CGD2]EEE10347.1 hypothetical protein BURMUCGD2M_0093 [Burkholderia multivorans CGD2M]EJO63497.1 hypothetical protein BURMUCF1_3459 [Burkholderia multivorans ATCC BAA-247]